MTRDQVNESTDWTRGPAKWFAAGVIALGSLACIGADLITDRQPASALVTDGASDAPNHATRIDINTTTAAELELLPRIGPALAKRIIEDRDENGPFESVDDLDRVRGIGPRTLDAIRDYVRTTASPE
ncbi:MAG TPA: helix-hairpin-helix domain-containing protein [Phycisphaerales bacterium]|nr:helix-hairpin-helix domain-containing protein [Phycisphaerales bacterium]